MALLSLALLLLASAAGLLLLALGLPGNWLALAGIFAAVALHPGASLSLGPAALLLGLCLGAEVLEAVCGIFGARRYGVSQAGVWAAVLGGFAGALIGGAALAVVGAVPGGFIGAFLSVCGVELARGRSRQEVLRSGYGAFISRLVGLVVKIGVTVAMASTGLIWLL